MYRSKMALTSWLLLSVIGCGPRQPPRDAQSAPPLRPPAPEDFVFGPGDVFDIVVWRQTDMNMTVRVAPDGNITYPLVGTVQVSGLSYPELVDTLEEGLSDYYVEPSVAVNVVEVSNQKVFVLGEVKNPAVLQVQGELSLLEALVRVGGISPDSRTDNVLLIRGDFEEPDLYVVDVSSLYLTGDTSQVVYLQRGDIVYVPARTIVHVERFFRRIQGILAPFVAGSAIYRNALSGGAQGTSSVLD